MQRTSLASAAAQTLRVAVYVRISQDRIGSGLGVQRQEDDARKLLSERYPQLDLSTVELYVDNDMSASNKRKPRKGWLRLIDDVKNGRIDLIVCWHIDRLTRQPRELEDVIDLHEQTGVELATCTGEVDLSTPTGRMVARIMGAAARHEVDHKAERQTSKHAELAAAGMPSGGGNRPFGYASNKISVLEVEADAIREAAGRVLAGESLGSVARDFEQRGIVGARGNAFNAQTLRQVLVSARISGRREHKPRSINDKQTTCNELSTLLYDAVWPAIITREQSDRLRAMLTSKERRSNGSNTSRKYLLSGLLICDTCSSKLVSNSWGGRVRYRCLKAPGRTNACGGVSISGARVDERVRDLALEAIDSSEFAERMYVKHHVDPALIGSIRDDETELVELATLKAERKITLGEWVAMRDVIDSRLTASRARLAKQTHTDALSLLVGEGDIVKRWDALNLSQQRAVLMSVFEHIVIKGTGVNGGWDAERVRPLWRV